MFRESFYVPQTNTFLTHIKLLNGLIDIKLLVYKKIPPSVDAYHPDQICNLAAELY